MAKPWASVSSRRRRAKPARRVKRRPTARARRAFRIDARHILLAIAVGSVALWLARHRPRARPRASGLEPPPRTLLPERHASAPFSPRAAALPSSARLASSERSGALPAVRIVAVPAESPDARLPWVQRAALAVHLGHPAELRRIASEMELVGRDAEAGLLGNYALLLERTPPERARPQRARWVNEVTRMLQAAMAHRRTPPPAEPVSSTPAPPATGDASAFFAAPAPGPCRQPFEDATADRPLTPMPVLAVERRRRAGR